MYYAAGAQTLNYFKIKDFKAKFDGKKWSWMGELTVLKKSPTQNKEPFERGRKSSVRRRWNPGNQRQSQTCARPGELNDYVTCHTGSDMIDVCEETMKK